jgi:hypothetical protein
MTNSARGNDVEDDPSVTPRGGARHRRRADLPVLFKLGQRCCRCSAPGRCWRTGGQNKRACTVWLRQKGPRRPGSGNYSGARAIPSASCARTQRRSRPATGARDGQDRDLIVAPQQSKRRAFPTEIAGPEGSENRGASSLDHLGGAGGQSKMTLSLCLSSYQRQR